jgi:hypothetical protein
MNAENITLIYAVRDNHWVRYVGKTCKALEWRLADHMNTARKGEQSHKGRGIRKMLQEGRLPTITLLAVANGTGSVEEKAWIAYFRSYGIDLWNETDGGDGISNPSAEVRRKIGDGNRGKVRSDEFKKNVSLSRKGSVGWWTGKTHSEATKRKMSLAQKGHSLSAEGKRKLHLANKGKKASLEARANMSLAAVKRFSSLEARQKHSLAHIGNVHSEESKRKMSKSHTGVPHPHFWLKGR